MWRFFIAQRRQIAEWRVVSSEAVRRAVSVAVYRHHPLLERSRRPLTTHHSPLTKREVPCSSAACPRIVTLQGSREPGYGLGVLCAIFPSLFLAPRFVSARFLPG